jgi:hypothetical protein
LSGLAPWSNTITVTAKDTTGNTTTALTTIYVDLAPPNLTIDPVVSPTNLITQTLSGTTCDNVGIAAVTVKIGTGTASAATISGGAWSYALPGLATGTNTITVTAQDTAGNTSSKTTTIIVDQTPPAVTINPVASPTSLTTQTLSGAISDNVGIAAVTVKIGSGSASAATISGGAWSYALAGLAAGTNTITVTAQDTAGNTSSKIAAIIVDQAPPSITINPVATPTALTTQTISGTISDTIGIASVTVKIGSGADSAATISGGTWSYDLSGLAPWSNTITVTAKDAAGNTATSLTTIYVDQAPPNLTIDPVVSPTKLTSQTLTGTVRDNIGVAAVTVKVGTGSAMAATVTGTTWSYTLSKLAAGTNAITVTARDSAGNTSIVPAIINVN